MTDDSVALAHRHLAMRWIGIPLFLLGFAGLCLGAGLLVLDQASWHVVLWYIGATALSLGAFGNHSDTGIAFMVQADSASLTPEMRSELREEFSRDRAGTLALRPHPMAAAAITLLAMLFHVLAAWKLTGEWL